MLAHGSGRFEVFGNRETREGWLLQTVVTEVNGDSKSTKKGPLQTVITEVNGDSKSTKKGALPRLVRSFLPSHAGTRYFCSAWAALVGPVQYIFFLSILYFNAFVPIAQQAVGRQQPCWIACLFLCVSVWKIVAINLNSKTTRKQNTSSKPSVII